MFIKKIDLLKLSDEIINGKRITKNFDWTIFENCDLEELVVASDQIRKFYVGDFVDLCSIVNAKSGLCSENCKFCAQSIYNKTKCSEYFFLDKEKIFKRCEISEKNKLHRFSLVTAARALTGKEFEKAISIIKELKKNFKIKLCASMGFLKKFQFKQLKEAGISTYHCNVETSEEFFSKICTTHTYSMKLETIKTAKEEGLNVCSGGIIGLGESFKDRFNMAISLFHLGILSIPVNVLIPIKGTPLENRNILKEEEILRTVAMFRFCNPKADIRLAAGRANLKNFGETAFLAGASAMIAGDMLTTSISSTIERDKQMLIKIGRTF